METPFGIKTAPAAYSRFMDIALSGLKWQRCLVYLDDILVFSKTFEQHLTDLDDVFSRLRDNGISLKAKKCEFCIDKIIYLGFQLSKEGIAPDPLKIKAVENMPLPASKKDVKTFT